MPKTAPRLQLTDRDTDVLATLSLRIRMASIMQIGRNWWAGCRNPESMARERLRALEAAGYIRSISTAIIALSELEQPLAVWKPGQMRPNLGAVAWKLKKRWEIPLQQSTVYFVTRRTAQYFAGSRCGGIPRSFQISHDLGVAEMHFAMRRLRPHLIQYWIDEDRFAQFRRGEKLPDAVLGQKLGPVPFLALEFGSGSYGKQRLEDFSEDCIDRGLSYEVW